RSSRPAKIDTCCAMRKELKAIAKTRPRYLARSPVSMRTATKFIAPPPAGRVRGAGFRCGVAFRRMGAASVIAADDANAPPTRTLLTPLQKQKACADKRALCPNMGRQAGHLGG